MSQKFKEINIKNLIHYFSNQYRSLDPDKTKINENSYTNIFIYFIGYVTAKDLGFAKN